VERRATPGAPLADVAGRAQEDPPRACGPQGGLRLGVREEPLEAHAEVVVIGLEPLQPRRLLGAPQTGLGALREPEEPASVPPLDLAGVARRAEPLARQVPDRLQHPEAHAGPPDEALADERLQPTHAHPHDPPGRLERAAAGEDREAREEPPLRLVEELVRPLDRRAQRPLARVGVAAALEEVEPLRDALADLRR